MLWNRSFTYRGTVHSPFVIRTTEWWLFFLVTGVHRKGSEKFKSKTWEATFSGCKKKKKRKMEHLWKYKANKIQDLFYSILHNISIAWRSIKFWKHFLFFPFLLIHNFKFSCFEGQFLTPNSSSNLLLLRYRSVLWPQSSEIHSLAHLRTFASNLSTKKTKAKTTTTSNTNKNHSTHKRMCDNCPTHTGLGTEVKMGPDWFLR